MLRRLADSNVKTLSDGAVTDGERKGLWPPLRRMFFIFIQVLFTLLFFSISTEADGTIQCTHF